MSLAWPSQVAGWGGVLVLPNTPLTVDSLLDQLMQLAALVPPKPVHTLPASSLVALVALATSVSAGLLGVTRSFWRHRWTRCDREATSRAS